MMMRLITLALMGILSAAAVAAPIELSKARIVVLNPKQKILVNAAAMLRDEIDKRTRIGLEVVAQMPQGDATVILIGTAEELAAKSYRPPSGYEVPVRTDACAVWVDSTQRQSPTICVAGHDDRGTLYAVGQLLRALEMGRDKLQLDSSIKLATAPRTALRGHQLGFRPKTNSYDAWTLAIWEQYFRDMIVFGMNAVELVPPRTDDLLDSPHYPKPPLEMMIAMSRLAEEYGLDVWIWFPWVKKDDSTSAIQTPEAALQEREEIFSKLPRIDAVFVPGGDPGEVHPDELFPFMEKQKRILNRYHAKATIWTSPQNYDDEPRTMGWTAALYKKLRGGQANWLDGVVFGPAVETPLPKLTSEVPSRFPIRNYPDITHAMNCQYSVPKWDEAYRLTEGREPINPRPYAYAKIYRDLYQYSIGFISYSEGCNDDVNKVVWSCLGWDPGMKVEEILLEYARHFIGRRFERRFAEGLAALEKNWDGPLLENESVPKTLNLFRELENEATPQDKLNWRFQQALYRAYYDAYVQARLASENDRERRAIEVLKSAPQIGALTSLDQAEVILASVETEKAASALRARVFELGEALFQSIRMQLSVPKYQAKELSRGANLDAIDTPLNRASDLRKRSGEIRKLTSEADRLSEIAKLAR